YLCTQVNKLQENPTESISLGSPKKELPKYLTMEESHELLKNIQSDFHERDFCIITLFLNCGMRLTELVTIDLGDFRDETIRIIGKGNKERLVYLNNACKDALEHYLKAREALPNLSDRQALFVSKKTGKRLTARRVEQIVERCLRSAGLAGRGYSPHKLRHTAATLMYQYGNADMLALKEILGHENVSTTQIYTHINQKQLRDAVEASPLAGIRYSAPSQQDTGEEDSQPGTDRTDGQNEQ
ncbi:MAG: tyrosine-type recombinase/integrase, partial [Gemmiger sp.]